MKNKSIEHILDSAHLDLSRAGFLIVMMIIRRKLIKSHIQESINKLSSAQKTLGELYDRS